MAPPGWPTATARSVPLRRSPRCAGISSTCLRGSSGNHRYWVGVRRYFVVQRYFVMTVEAGLSLVAEVADAMRRGHTDATLATELATTLSRWFPLRALELARWGGGST